MLTAARFPLRALNLSRVSCDMSDHRTVGGKDAPFPFLGSFFILGIPGQGRCCEERILNELFGPQIFILPSCIMRNYKWSECFRKERAIQGTLCGCSLSVFSIHKPYSPLATSAGKGMWPSPEDRKGSPDLCPAPFQLGGGTPGAPGALPAGGGNLSEKRKDRQAWWHHFYLPALDTPEAHLYP